MAIRLDSMSMVMELLAESRNQRGAADAPEEMQLSLSALSSTSAAIPLPPTVKSGTSLEAVLRARRAVRHYDAGDLDPAELSTILAAAEAADRRDWQGERTASVSLHFFLLAWRVRNIEPGVYRYAPPESIIRVGDIPPQEAAADLMLQREFAQAPAVLLVTGQLANALTRHGAHGHRQLLLRAGTAAHAAWLAAIGLGVVGSVFAGVLPTAAQQLTGIDGYLDAPLFALAVGHPALA